MQIKCLTNYMTSENTYIVSNGAQCFAVDPSCPYDRIIAAADGAKITHILLTHCHYDHIGTVNELREKTGALLVSSSECSKNIGDPSINLTLSLGEPIVCAPADLTPADGESFTAAGLAAKIIYTPGHTSGGACFLFGDTLFSGDTLFLRSVGRSDLPTGDGKTLLESIAKKLYVLDDGVEVYPGHGEKTSIGYEKKFNFFTSGI